MRVTAVLSGTVAAVCVAASLLPTAVATAAPCPDVEVIFARGRFEPPGIGRIGQAFVDALRADTTKSVGVYGVNYVADWDIVPGANDMSRHMQYMATNCPNTRQVPGGYSLGAAVVDVVLGATESQFGFNNPLPASVADHVAAVVLFGNGTRSIFGPVSAENSPLYGPKTIDQCNVDDPICNGIDPATLAGNWSSHLQDAYIGSGLVAQAASFTASRL
ncbi:cutinase family protein [Mycobacterium sp. CVI_P3]|uniref:Cutinase family protein n=2 Tax=Mycobacterium pinniadriaticum TaxID=2994102 RepID=A0ABT3SFM9_9MYCO|nr:cutinase family protein [Mycobacterium pinniadriaticum]MCX2931089.1 cutinase family protein [Mycobacterium pinniadriaticum]MCX2937687.1 cutinase family protein [Mycobacterium pinniadriaticum]